MKLNAEDYIGKRFWSLVVIGSDNSVSHFNANRWIFLCDCGKSFSEKPSRVLSGHRKSCGCQKGKASLTHGCNGDEFYHTWWSMMRRCYNKEAHNYERYGGRGITVCPEWHNPETFIQWARKTIGHKVSGLSLDRIDNEKGYSPENCKWSTPKEQCRNRRSTTYGIINGEEKSLAEWCEIYGIGIETARRRIQSGMTFKDAVTIPVGFSRKQKAAP